MALPILTRVQVRAWEAAAWASGQTETAVIDRVGQRLAERIRQLTCEGDLILLLVGQGHNGDDARAAIPYLNGRPCACLDVTNPANQLPELKKHLCHQPALIVDALFGIGLNRHLDASWVAIIEAVNNAGISVVSIDVPSGLDADKGEPLGDAVRAGLTFTVGTPKAGLLKTSAWPFVGRLEVSGDVGLGPIPECDAELWWIEQQDFAQFPPTRSVTSHKGSFGHLGIVAGSEGFHGAAVLATHAAQRAQPGLVTLHTMAESYWPAAAQLQSAMVRPWNPDSKLTSGYSALMVGPGLAAPEASDAFGMLTRKLWRDAKVPVVVDATALHWLSAEPLPKDVVRVITPHPGEAARLLKTTSESIQASRVESLREISKRFGDCWVVLKGHQTLIGRSSGEIFVNGSGNPKLAQGGSGDVLAGFIAGLLAQPALQTDVAKTVAYAVHEHGAAADRLCARQRNWMVEDLVRELGNAP